MKKGSKISVIVAAYNTEKYIEKCIDSLLKQTYENLEIVIVEDKSTDNTKEKLKKYKDKKIKLIENDKNRGLSYSRNIAIENSTGDYIGFIDSDDYVAETYYEELMNSIEEHKSDIAVGDINLVYEENGTSSLVKCGDNKDKTKFINNGLAASCCNKLFKREVITTYKFSEGKVNEDLAVTLPLLIKNKVSYTEKAAYQYVQRQNSIQNSKITDKRFDIFYGVDLTIDRIEGCEDYQDYKDMIVFQQLILLFLYVLASEKSLLNRIKWFKKYNKLAKKYEIKNNKYLLEFLEEQGKLHTIYYATLVGLESSLPTLAAMEVTVFNILKKIRTKNVLKKEITLEDVLEAAKKQDKLEETISLSVVVPNYNYEKYMNQRIYSVLNQKVKISELIILDDVSKDNSRELIKEMTEKIKEVSNVNVSYVFNEQNSGSAFKQWEKGFDLATKEYVWIAEADDYCDKNFLEKVTKPIIEDKEIRISYADTAFIDGSGTIIMRTIKPEIDIMKTGHWDKDFINDGKEEYKNYAFLNCTIANVSSAIIKKDNYKDFFKLSGEYKQAGDWLFYVNVMHKGKISFINKPLNYYRVHGANVSSVTKKEAHIKEIKNIHKYYRDTYGLDERQEKEIEKRYDFLEKNWDL